MSLAFDDPECPNAGSCLRTDTLTDSVLVLLALTAVQRLVGFLRAVLFCRWLDPQQLGLWDMAFSFLLLAAPLSAFAIPGWFGTTWNTTGCKDNCGPSCGGPSWAARWWRWRR